MSNDIQIRQVYISWDFQKKFHQPLRLNQNIFRYDKCMLVGFGRPVEIHVEFYNTLKMMPFLRISILFSAFLLSSNEPTTIEIATPINQLTIMASVVEPFVTYHSNQSALIGLDVKIIENFAKRFKLEPKFIMTNQSLLEVFTSDDRAARFLRSVQHL